MEEGLSISVAHNFTASAGLGCATIGEHLRYAGDYVRAEPYIRRSVEYLDQVAAPQRTIAARSALACLLAATGRVSEALHYLREALPLFPAWPASLNLAHCAEACAFICFAQGDLPRAYGFMVLLRDWLARSGEVFLPKHIEQMDEMDARLIAALPEEDRVRLAIEARTKTRREVVETFYALVFHSSVSA